MIGSSRSYAIGMAHFQLAGGVVSLGIMLGAYTLIFGAVVGSYLYYDSARYWHAGITDVAITILFLIQTMVLLVFGSIRVALAIRNDISSRMMESHRLMPIPAWRAVTGYLLGGTVHVIAFAALTLVFAWILALPAHASLGDVAFNQGMLLLFAALVWSAAALSTLIYRHGFFIALAALMVGTCSSVLVYASVLLPGLLLLIGPLLGHSIFRYSVPASPEWGYVASIVGQLLFFALFFNAACRRYRGMYATTFTATQSVLLILAWVFVTVCGMRAWDQFDILKDMLEDSPPDGLLGGQVVASLLSAMVLGLIAACSIAMEEATSKRMKFLAWPFLLLTIAAICLIPCGNDLSSHLNAANLAIGALTVMPYLLAAFLFCRWYRTTRFGFILLFLALATLVLWMGPLAVGLIAYLILPYDSHLVVQMITTLSPIGLLVDRWVQDDPVSPIAGVIAQWVGPGVLVLLAWAMRSRRKKSAGGGSAPPVAALPGAVGSL